MAAFDRVPRREFLDRRKVVFQDLRYTTHPERLVAAQAGFGLYDVSGRQRLAAVGLSKARAF
jgi:hypothetical protein